MCKCCSNGKDARRKKHYAFLHEHNHSHEDAGHGHEHGHEHHHPSRKGSREMATESHGEKQGLLQK